MKRWKIVIKHNGKELEVIMEEKFYSDAYVNVELKYPGCVIISLTEIRDKK